ncbi:hypothetical protein OS493_010478 [Desmophyllum pertusum]|uniref:Uncharacterized protein n=1 Tax=Desmophyllum pertusum TaxID=174260 RepID=A0A9X0DBM9_9CNID|nr:hypothetical protein OS493_010478 [Desmophyllum pertusum]
MERLKLQERRLLALAEHELKHFFGKPYENNYYTGAWMLGPSQRCKSEPIASLQRHVNVALYIFLTKGSKTLKVAKDAMDMLPKFQEGINQYKLNLQRGVASGMIRSVSECTAGVECMKRNYLDVFTRNTPEAVLSWPGVRSRIQDFVSRVPIRNLSAWIDTYGKNMSDSLYDGVAKFVGTPLVSLFEYLQNDHMIHCVPGNVSSGLGTRPVEHVYINGTRTSEKTNQTLDGSERIMKGKDAYAGILSYFTTTSYTPGKYKRLLDIRSFDDEAHDLGWKQLTSYYRQAVDIAKMITGQENESQAVFEFKSRLNSYSLFINKQPFPKNESDEVAFQKCRNKKCKKK